MPVYMSQVGMGGVAVSTSLPLTYSTLQYWFDGNDSTLMEATSGGGGGNPTVGNPVGRMKGYAYGGGVVNGFDAISSSTRALRASGGGVTGDGTDDQYIGFNSLSFTSGFFVCAVIISTDYRNNKGLVGRWGSSGNQWGLLPSSFGTSTDAIAIIRNSSDSASGSVSGAGVSNGTKRFLAMHWDSTTLTLNRDGVETTSAVSSIRNTTGDVALFSYLTGVSSSCVAATLRDIQIYTGSGVTALNSTARAALRTWTMARY